MSKQCLDVQQMQHLQELGLDTSNASLCWIKTPNGRDLTFNDEWVNLEESILDPVPAYTLQDVLDALPENIYSEYIGWAKLELQAYSEDKWVAGYRYIDTCNRYIIYRDEKELIDAAYKMLCWAIENGYIETIRYESEN